MPGKEIGRRLFLRMGTVSLVTSPRIVLSSTENRLLKQPSRSVSFHNLHTAEQITSVYWIEGRYIPESLAGINRILRDHRNDEVYEIVPQLLDTLCALRLELETNKPFELISGYRSPRTNAVLRSQGAGVAENSLHMKGMAADIRIPGLRLAVLRRAAVSLKAGGVGYYPASQFVHIDIGRIRTW